MRRRGRDSGRFPPAAFVRERIHITGDMFGRDLVPGSGVAVEIVEDLLLAGESVEAVAREFGIPESVIAGYVSHGTSPVE